jgi:hypothetical protein
VNKVVRMAKRPWCNSTSGSRESRAGKQPWIDVMVAYLVWGHIVGVRISCSR